MDRAIDTIGGLWQLHLRFPQPIALGELKFRAARLSTRQGVVVDPVDPVRAAMARTNLTRDEIAAAVRDRASTLHQCFVMARSAGVLAPGPLTLLGPVFKFARRKADNDYGYDYVDDPVFVCVPS